MENGARLAENEKPKDPSPQSFILKYSNHVIEHLGVKLYQNKPTNALAELISNAWDADANNVWIDQCLDGPRSNWWISIGDDGYGMTGKQVQEEYLVIGRKRRSEEDETTKKGRPLMGRKGIGKLAPFGIAQTISLFTVQEGTVTWLSFDLKAMLEQTEDASESTIYKPVVEFTGTWEELLQRELEPAVKTFITRIAGGLISGTLILLTDLTIRSKSWSANLGAHLANRLIPALLEDDFTVVLDGEVISVEESLPSYALRIPEEGWQSAVLPSGREYRSWALVVDLERYHSTFDEDWTQENAGVAVYAHKKIAQDRPFFFELKGREIYARYVYGIVEADWIDDLSEDLISTDRTSLDWDHGALVELKQAGQALVKNWVKQAQAHLKKKRHKEVTEATDKRLNEVAKQYREKFSRREVIDMSDTIMALAPRASVNKVVDITMSAVAHLASWELLKHLVRNAQLGELSEDVFGQIVFDLRFFENVNLAQVIARRLKAMLALERLIARGAREVTPGQEDETASVSSMHDLLRNNAWLLELRWAAVADELPPQLTGKALEAIHDKMVRKYGEEVREFEGWRKVGKKAMDFVMLHVTEFQNVVIVVEIKRANKSLTVRDHRQLQDYMDLVTEVLEEHGMQECSLEGILIGGKIGAQLRHHLGLHTFSTITVTTWKDMLEDARRSHQEFLRALAVGLHDDPRLRSYLQDLEAA
jgi:hypothetical protein